MADFCRQCSLEIFGEDFGDFHGLTTPEDWDKAIAVAVLCEGCGPIQVSPDGQCISNCLKDHHLWLCCEVCDTPDDCLAGRTPCWLCGEFICQNKIQRECLNSWLEVIMQADRDLV